MAKKQLEEYFEWNCLRVHKCVFRKNRSTLDHLVRLDTYVGKDMTRNEEDVAVFFDFVALVL